MAGRRQHAVLLAHQGVFLASAADHSGEPGICRARIRADFLRSFVGFAQGKIVSDNSQAPGVEIGRPGDTYRRVRIESKFGKITVLVTDGHLPFPYGRETMGYDVADVGETLNKGEGVWSNGSGRAIQSGWT